MFDAVDISLHPSRWQWLATKYSVHGLGKVLCGCFLRPLLPRPCGV